MKEYNKDLDLTIYRWKEGPDKDLAEARLDLIRAYYGEDDEEEEGRSQGAGTGN